MAHIHGDEPYTKKDPYNRIYIKYQYYHKCSLCILDIPAPKLFSDNLGQKAFALIQTQGRH